MKKTVIFIFAMFMAVAAFAQGGKELYNKYSGNVGGSNNKWAHDYKCSDGSHVFIYDLSTQNFATGGLLPTSSVAEFTTFQFKYADIATTNPSEKVIFNVYWVQTFKTVKDVQNYIEDVDGLTFEVIK